MELFFSSDASGFLLLSLLVVSQVIEFPRNVAKCVIVTIVDVGRVREILLISQNSQVYGTKSHFLIVYLLKNHFLFNKMQTLLIAEGVIVNKLAISVIEILKHFK